MVSAEILAPLNDLPRRTDGSNPEGVAVDALGNVHGAALPEGGVFVKSTRR